MKDLVVVERLHIRPQVGENRASRPISRTQAPNRSVSIAVGDHARILAVVCFFILIFWLSLGPGQKWGGVENDHDR